MGIWLSSKNGTGRWRQVAADGRWPVAGWRERRGGYGWSWFSSDGQFQPVHSAECWSDLADAVAGADRWDRLRRGEAGVYEDTTEGERG